MPPLYDLAKVQNTLGGILVFQDTYPNLITTPGSGVFTQLPGVFDNQGGVLFNADAAGVITYVGAVPRRTYVSASCRAQSTETSFVTCRFAVALNGTVISESVGVSAGSNFSAGQVSTAWLFPALDPGDEISFWLAIDDPNSVNTGNVVALVS